MDARFSRQYFAGLDDLTEIRQFLESKAAELRVNPSTTYDIALAVTELVTNTVIYGYQKKPGFIEVEMCLDNDSLTIHLRDHATPFNPTLMPTPDLSLPLEKREMGGLGIFLARQAVDQLTYRELPQGGNEVTLVIHQISTRDHDERNDEYRS